jgi:hypothetical protein
MQDGIIVIEYFYIFTYFARSGISTAIADCKRIDPFEILLELSRHFAVSRGFFKVLPGEARQPDSSQSRGRRTVHRLTRRTIKPPPRAGGGPYSGCIGDRFFLAQMADADLRSHSCPTGRPSITLTAYLPVRRCD